MNAARYRVRIPTEDISMVLRSIKEDPDLGAVSVTPDQLQSLTYIVGVDLDTLDGRERDLFALRPRRTVTLLCLENRRGNYQGVMRSREEVARESDFQEEKIAPVANQLLNLLSQYLY